MGKRWRINAEEQRQMDEDCAHDREHQRLKDAALEALHEWRDGFIETEELFAAHDALLAFESTTE